MEENLRHVFFFFLQVISSLNAFQLNLFKKWCSSFFESQGQWKIDGLLSLGAVYSRSVLIFLWP